MAAPYGHHLPSYGICRQVHSQTGGSGNEIGSTIFLTSLSVYGIMQNLLFQEEFLLSVNKAGDEGRYEMLFISGYQPIYEM